MFVGGCDVDDVKVCFYVNESLVYYDWFVV